MVKFSFNLDQIRLKLSRSDALIYLSFFGLLTGLLSGAVIITFRLVVEHTQAFLLHSHHENYESLPPLQQFIFPLIGGILLALFFKYFGQGFYVTGITKVMERMAYHQGYIRLRGLVVQFVGAALAIIGGFSIGQEGPHTYLGAASGSQLGQAFSLPNNSIRTMAACGVASGIAASFNTPLAGVIFALEVIMMDYSLASFIPIILSAVSATALSNAILGNHPAFIVPHFQLASLSDLPIVFILGLACGALGSLFIFLVENITKKTRHIMIWWRVLIAAAIMSLFAITVPQVMGIGYDSITSTLLAEYSVGMLLTLLFAKLMATSICLSLGLPGGMIGPAFLLGAVLGSLVGIAIHLLVGGNVFIGFYAVIGMGAMFGACFQAPLAALTAIMELTNNPDIIMPSMLAIVVAQLTASEVFKKKSIYLTMLKANGLDYNAHPALQTLRRLGVASEMDTQFIRTDALIDFDIAEGYLNEPDIQWLIINDKTHQPFQLMPMVELAKALKSEQASQQYQQKESLNLLEIPATRLQLGAISFQASMQEAHEMINSEQIEALFVVYHTAIKKQDYGQIHGILTQQMIARAYLL